GIGVEHLGLTRQRAEPDALGAAGGKAVGQALIEVEARSAVDRDDFDAAPRSSRNYAKVQFAAPGVLEQVTAQLGGEQVGAPGIGGVEVVLFGQPLGDPAGVADLAVVFDQQDLGDASLNVHVHRVMVIR